MRESNHTETEPQVADERLVTDDDSNGGNHGQTQSPGRAETSYLRHRRQSPKSNSDAPASRYQHLGTDASALVSPRLKKERQCHSTSSKRLPLYRPLMHEYLRAPVKSRCSAGNGQGKGSDQGVSGKREAARGPWRA